MSDSALDVDALLRRVQDGEQEAAATLFGLYRDRLRRMVRLRMDHRLQGRIDPSDVLQEAYIDLSRRLPEYTANPTLPFFLWLRLLTGQRLLALHRHHVLAQKRSATQEVPLNTGATPEASSLSLAADLLSRFTSPTQAAMRAEMQRRLQDVLDGLDPIDREVLVLRHFEEMTNNETAAVLGLQKAAASNRYVRALQRLRDVLASLPGFLEEV